MGIPEKIKSIQDEMARTQINKATEHHIGLLKAKIAKLKREQEAEVTKKSGMKQDGFNFFRYSQCCSFFALFFSIKTVSLCYFLLGMIQTYFVYFLLNCF